MISKTIRNSMIGCLLLSILLSGCRGVSSSDPLSDTSSSESESESVLVLPSESANTSSEQQQSEASQASESTGPSAPYHQPDEWNGYPILRYDYSYDNGRYPYSNEMEDWTLEEYLSEERYPSWISTHRWDDAEATGGLYTRIGEWSEDGTTFQYAIPGLYHFNERDGNPAYRLVCPENVAFIRTREDGILIVNTVEGRWWKMGSMGESPVLLADIDEGSTSTNFRLEGKYCIFYTADADGAFHMIYVATGENRALYTPPDGYFACGFPVTNRVVSLSLWSTKTPGVDYGMYLYDFYADKLYLYDAAQVPEELSETFPQYGFTWFGESLYPLDPAARAECPWLVPVDGFELP